MAKFIVTGGAGFIGSNIVGELVKRGHRVKVIDNLSTGHRSNLQDVVSKIQFVKGDIRNLALLEKEFLGFDYILHQAALRSVTKSLLKPKDYNNVNINGTLAVLQAAVKNKVKRLVFASSSSIYGEIDKFPAKETFLPQLIAPYPLSKLAGEYYCRIFSKHYKIGTVCLRYFNVFGPKQSAKDEYALVIPKFITFFLHGEKPTVYGDGRQSRDFTYIDNVVEANISAATKGKIAHEIFNVASGKDYTILELIKELNNILGVNIKPTFLPKRPGDAPRTLADISKISKQLNFKPKINFIEGLKRTVEWSINEKK